MSQFTVEMESNLKPSISAMLMNSNIDILDNLNELDSFNSSVQDLISLPTHEGFSDHNQRSQIPFTFTNDTSYNPNASHHDHHLQIPENYDSAAHFFPQGGGPILSESDCLANSSPRLSGTTELVANNKAIETQKYGGRKRKRNNETEMEKPREVVHVRAKRGQATDSHSLAERLRRQKINEKLRCLQDLVPGCYKTMGMAVMLDVVINYVRSLQNQIDFLSMKLSTASLFYDFNSSDIDDMGTMKGTHGCETQGPERMVGEGCGVLPQFHTSWPF